MLSFKCFTVVVALLINGVAGFSSFSVSREVSTPQHTIHISVRRTIGIRMSLRRTFFEESLGVAALTFLIGTTVLTPQCALASGGATAGGVYLLSAKQRYNARVADGVKRFLSLESPLTNGDLASIRSFFTDEEKGSWKDMSTAAYLLANAFRRNSSAAPDTLPAVKVCWLLVSTISFLEYFSLMVSLNLS
jgi:hypothetical protein